MIKKENLNVDFKELKYIHHISDIQIRNLKRHKEYEEVFERTYEEVRKNKDNAVAYIGGDIAHSKTEMSPELVDQLSRLFKNLSDICPTLIIAGNHDCNLNNRSRLDVLTPIVNNLNHPNLYYLKDSGIYTCADTKFVVWDCWSDESDFITSDKVDGDTKVVLFHGTVDRAQTDLGFRLPSDVHIDKFKGYDLGLLGDIHKRQFLNDEETIAYCGSLVQQNHGEGLSHGYLLWDVPKRKSKYIEIPNDYGYYTIDIDNGELPEIKDMPKKARLRVRVSNTNGTELKKCLSIVHKQYGIYDITVTRTDGLELNRGEVKEKIDVGDITNPNYQYELIENFLKRNSYVDDETLLKIKKINDDLNLSMPEEDISRNVDWVIKKFEFENMFSYGDKNIVDFTKIMGINGLFAPNASGKSSLLDALSFCLFDTSSRAPKAENVLNNKKNNFWCKLNFEINDINYYIERRGKKSRNGHVKVNVDFWMVDEVGEKVSLNGDQRRTTNFNIKKVIGSYEDFILTTLSLQNNSTVFIDKTQKERKELLAQFMGIGIFDKLYTMANQDISDISAILKDFKKTDYDKQLSDTQKEIEQISKTYKSLIKERDNHLGEEKQLNKDILDLTKKLKPLDDSITNIDELEKTKNEFSKLLSENKSGMDSIVSDAIQTKSKKADIESEIEIHLENKVEEKFQQLKKYELENETLNNDIEKLKIDVSHKKDKKKLIDLISHFKENHDVNCKYCAENEVLSSTKQTEELIEKDAILARSYIEKRKQLDTKLDELKKIKSQKNDYDDLLTELKNITDVQNNLVSQQTLLIEKNKNYETQINVIDEKIQKYYEQENDIKYNKEIENDISDLKETIDSLSSLVQQFQNKVNDTNGRIKILETEKNNIKDTIVKVEEYESKYQAYKYYLDAVKRDGVPYELIMKALPTIEGEVNNILSQLVDFGIVLQMDGKNINCLIVYDDDNIWPLELSSGMERFISSLAIRVGLINVSNLPRTNFLAIDEGWGTMDSDNLNSVYNLFQYLKSQFQFTLIVSHIESMRDAVDSLLEIKKENGYSNINYV